MRMPRFRFSMRGMMVAVAVLGLASLAARHVHRNYPDSERRTGALLGSLVGVAVGLGAMRHPLTTTVTILLIWFVMPNVDHPGAGAQLIGGGVLLGWVIGVPAGLIPRKSAGPKHINPFKPSPPDSD